MSLAGAKPSKSVGHHVSQHSAAPVHHEHHVSAVQVHHNEHPLAHSMSAPIQGIPVQPQMVKKTTTTTETIVHHPAPAQMVAPQSTTTIFHPAPVIISAPQGLYQSSSMSQPMMMHSPQPSLTIINNHVEQPQSGLFGHSLAMPLMLGGSGYHTTAVHHEYHQQGMSVASIVMITLIALLLVVCICAYCQTKTQEKEYDIEERPLTIQKKEEVKTQYLYTAAGEHDESYENTNFQYHPDGSVTEFKTKKTVKYEPQETQDSYGQVPFSYKFQQNPMK